MKKIYVAEDSPAQAEHTRKTLAPLEECQVTVFSDGLEFYQAALKEPPDLLLVDMLLPSLEGLAICRLLKFHEDYKHIPVLVFNSSESGEASSQAHSMGADAFLRKPFNPQSLLGEVRSLLKLKH